MKEVVFAVPGSLAPPTGGYAYDRRIIAELGVLGWRVHVLDLGEGFPFPSDATRRRAEHHLAALSPQQSIIIDGLAFGVLAEIAQSLASTHRFIAFVHHPLAMESGLTAAQADALRLSETAALACARHTITVSEANRRVLHAQYGVPSDRLSVVRPGTDRVPDRVPGRERLAGGPVALLAVGTIVPRKGYDVLIPALAPLMDLPWHLTIVGDAQRHAGAAERLTADIARFALGERITLAGTVEPAQLADFYAAADLFVLASRLEGYGMVFAEAIAHGLPIVSTTAPAIPETVPASAGILVPPDHVDALATALRRLIADPQQRRELAAGARRAAMALPTWREAGRGFDRVLASIA